MPIMTAFLVTMLLACSSSATAEPTAGLAWETYVDPQLQVSVQNPSWAADPVNRARFQAPDGFFQLHGAAGVSPDVVAQAHASRILQPFGSSATISRLVVDGQPARSILPSDGQAEAMDGLAEVLIQASSLIQIGGDSYNFVVLYADKDHILAIAQTLQFTAPP